MLLLITYFSCVSYVAMWMLCSLRLRNDIDGVCSDSKDLIGRLKRHIVLLQLVMLAVLQISFSRVLYSYSQILKTSWIPWNLSQARMLIEFEVVMTLAMRSMVFWVIILCSLEKVQHV
jgi:hypothetical protein